MIIKSVLISVEIATKIYEKHNVEQQHVKDVMLKDEPIFRRVGGGQCLAIGNWNGYLTIFFRYNNDTKTAIITTAYHSKPRQIKFYKRNK